MPTAFLRRAIAATFVFGFIITTGCDSNSPGDPIDTDPVLASWANCPNALDDIVWLAVQDGTGPWRRIAESGGKFDFEVDSGRAGVAYVVAGYPGSSSTYVRYYGAAELKETQPRCYSEQAVGKSIHGSVGAMSTGEYADIVLANALGYASRQGNGPSPFSLERVAEGAADLLAARQGPCGLPANCIGADAVIIRRNVDAPAGSTLPELAFDSGEAFQLLPRTLTISGVSASDNVSIDEDFITARNAMGLSLMRGNRAIATSSTVTLPFRAVPAAHLEAGDEHRLFLGVSSQSLSREAIIPLADAVDRTVALIAPIGTPTITSSRQTGFATARATLNSADPYQGWYAEFTQLGADIVIRVSAAYNGSGPVTLSVPDLSGATGWQATWGLKAGTTTHWYVSGINLPMTAVEKIRIDALPEFQASSRSGTITP
jgi:hypothetical protein